MPRVVWLPEALADVHRLYKFLHDKHPDAAVPAACAILDGSKLLGHAPELGRPMDDDTNRRELFVELATGAYVLRYMYDLVHNPVIIRVWHSREQRSG